MSESPSNRSIRIEESAVGSSIISGDGNTIYIVHQATEQKLVKELGTSSAQMSSNPYMGLSAFKEDNADNYFGREVQVERIRQRFQSLCEQSITPRFLSLLGPSGCGKSSLARAGLIPSLAKSPLPGKKHMKVIVAVPGAHPVEALAGGLAKAATDDPLPIEKAAEFERVLMRYNDAGEYDGLRRIVNLTSDSQDIPLVILIDQFEEVYSLCKNNEHRQAFIGNLLQASSDSTGKVFVVIALRSDFLNETQCHEQLNQVIGSDQSIIVPAMTPEELRSAIIQPAMLAGYTFDEPTISLLVEQTCRYRGALPLLQFTLTRIWEELSQGKEPISTLKSIGGVGGALAAEAQRLYNSLDTEERHIARRTFLRLVQLDADSTDIRRRATLSELISVDSGITKAKIQAIIRKFSTPSIRFLTTSVDEYKQIKIEVTHEALIHQWGQLKVWLSDCQQDMHQNRQIEESTQEWIHHDRSSQYLLDGRPLQIAKIFRQETNRDVELSSLASEFLDKSLKKRRQSLLKLISAAAIAPLCGTLVIIHYFILGVTESVLARENCQPSALLGSLLSYQYRIQRLSPKTPPRFTAIDLCGKQLDRINLSKAILEDANFKEARLNRAVFVDALLPRANFENSEMIEANLKRAYLADANLSMAVLISADLQGAYLDSANLKGAKLKNASLHGVDLSSTLGLSAPEVLMARLCETKLPKPMAQELPEGIENRDCNI